MFTPNKDEVRAFIRNAWQKHREGRPLEGLEAMIADIVTVHPEYHTLLEGPPEAVNADYPPDAGQMNPFLHLSLHLAIAEQVSIDQPAGVRERYRKLTERCGDAMAAQHHLIDCLAEMIWQAQRSGTPYDAAAYLACIDRKLGSAG